MYTLSSFVAGLVFGVGLIVSGLVNPSKVFGFLDLAGSWDPSLALVMAGAIAVGLPAFFVAGKRAVTLLGTPMQLPNTRQIDRRTFTKSLLTAPAWLSLLASAASAAEKKDPGLENEVTDLLKRERLIKRFEKVSRA